MEVFAAGTGDGRVFVFTEKWDPLSEDEVDNLSQNVLPR